MNLRSLEMSASSNEPETQQDFDMHTAWDLAGLFIGGATVLMIENKHPHGNIACLVGAPGPGLGKS